MKGGAKKLYTHTIPLRAIAMENELGPGMRLGVGK